jgi:hypothetical protein
MALSDAGLLKPQCTEAHTHDELSNNQGLSEEANASQLGSDCNRRPPAPMGQRECNQCCQASL